MVLANTYVFDQGADGELKYIDADVSGSPQLVYKEKVYAGNEIKIENLDIGKTATVELEFVADSHTNFLTLLIPPVNIESSDGAAYVTSYAVLAKSLTTIAGPSGISGQTISYEARFVAGSASNVET